MNTDSETWEDKLQQGLMGKLKATFRWGIAGKVVRSAQLVDQADQRAAVTPEKAIKLYSQAIDLLTQIQGMDEVRQQLLGAAYLRRGRLQEEVGMVQEALESYLQSRGFFSVLPEPVADFITVQYARAGLASEEALNYYLNFLQAHRGELPSPETGEIHKFLQELSVVNEDDHGKKALERLTVNRKIIKADPNLEWAQYHAGIACFLLKKYEDAVAHLRKARELKSRKPQLDYYLAFSRGLRLMKLEQWEPAVQALRAATQTATQRAEAFQALGGALLKLAEQAPSATPEQDARLIEAASSIEQAVTLAPQNADYAFQWGQALLLIGNQSGAIQAFRQSVQWAPRRSPYFLHLGLTLKQSGALEEAREAALKALDLEKENQAEPRSLAAVHRLLGEICLELGELDTAVTEFQHVLEYLPGDPKVRQDLGATLFRLNRWAEAVPILEPVAEESPAAMFHLARCLSQIEHYDLAVEWLERLAVRQPSDPQACYFLGLGYAHQERFSEAVAAFGQAIALSETQPSAFLQRANALMQLGRSEEARADYQKALALAPDDPDILFHMGCFCRQLGDEEGAATYLSRVIQQDPHHLGAHLSLGELHEKGGRFSEALEVYEAAVALAPLNPVILRRLGVLHFRQGELEDSADRLQKSAELGDDSDELVYYQGQVARALQQWDTVLKAWQLLSQRHPEDESLSLNLHSLHYLYGQQHLEAGKLPEAIREWQACVEVSPQDDKIRRHLAALHFRLALQELRDGGSQALMAARHFLEQAHNLDPDNCQYPYYLALCHLMENRGAEFLGSVEALIPHLDPRTQVHARYHQAIHWLNLGNEEKAAALLAELQPQAEQQGMKLEVHIPLSLIQARDGHWQEAAALLASASIEQG
jgi:tetratricopeptide (TPR) repeat protein